MSFNNKLRHQLSAHDRYVKGNPIVINFKLENLSNDNLWVLKWYTPLEGVKGKIFRVLCDGKEILYEGPMMKRGNPTKDDYIQIDQGNSASAEVDLSKAYGIPACGECLVEFKGRIYDISTSADSIPRSSEEQQIVTITGNTVAFCVFNS